MAGGAGAVDAPEIGRALAAYGGLAAPQVSRIPVGLIHQSFAIRERGVDYVLQRVNPIFSAGIHENIYAVTEHLHAKGICTLRLMPTREGGCYADLGNDGIWRLMTRVPGTTFEVCSTPAQARSAGALVARFHSALSDLQHDFQPLGIPLHDTAAHLAELARALDDQRDHRLYERVAPLAEEILRTASGWEDLAALPRRVVHGDLKFNNVLFAGGSGAGKREAVTLIDLDTVARMPLWAELGDAWRSWCNRNGEDSPDAALDLGLWEAAVRGYRGAVSLELEPAERAALGEGLERISLELAARFAADALRERYFGWNPARFPSRGDHNLTRALGQLSLHRQARATRAERLPLLLD